MQVLRLKSAHASELVFCWAGVPACFANALRRTIVSNIKTAVLLEPTFTSNTSFFHNEILSERLKCVPVHKLDPSGCTLRVSEKNADTAIMAVTTEHFKVYDKDDKEVDGVFPPTVVYVNGKQHKTYIEFARLKPATAANAGEELAFTCKFGQATAAECGAYAVASTCAYKHSVDAEGKDKEDSFDFLLESVGVIKPHDLVLLAADVILAQLERLGTELGDPVASDTTMENCYDLTFDHDDKDPLCDFTVGMMLRAQVYALTKDQAKCYVAFYKNHPHDPYFILRLVAEDPLTVVRAAITALKTQFLEFKDLFHPKTLRPELLIVFNTFAALPLHEKRERTLAMNEAEGSPYVAAEIGDYDNDGLDKVVLNFLRLKNV